MLFLCDRLTTCTRPLGLIFVQPQVLTPQLAGGGPSGPMISALDTVVPRPEMVLDVAFQGADSAPAQPYILSFRTPSIVHLSLSKFCQTDQRTHR